MPTNASTPFLGGNPLSFSSGFINQTVKGMFKIQRLYWNKPDFTSTSSLLVTKRTPAGMTYAKMDVDTSSAGVGQVLNLGDQWWQDPCFIVPTGTFYVYLDD